MKTIIKKVNPLNIDKEDVLQAAEIIKKGGIVAFPTETVYGLGGDALNKDASEKIYAAKGRPSDNPLIAHISKIEDLDRLVCEIPKTAKILMDKYWPGPLTIIFNKKDEVPMETTGGLETIGVRMPQHPVAAAFIEAAATPIAAPSANISGKPSPTNGQHVIDDLNLKVDMIIDSGSVGIGLESTIVDVTCTPPMLLRPGYVTYEMLKEDLGEVLIDKAILNKPSEDLRPKAPGMKYRHYAPKAEFIMLDGEAGRVNDAIWEKATQDINDGKKVGIITTDEYEDFFRQKNGVIIKSLGKSDDMEQIAHNIYAVLRFFDKTDVERIYAGTFMGNNFGQAVMNRLSKAAGYHIERV